MKVINAPEKYNLQENEVSVFLAGGITNCPNWQKEIITGINKSEYGSSIVIFNPRRENFPINIPSAAVEVLRELHIKRIIKAYRHVKGWY